MSAQTGTAGQPVAVEPLAEVLAEHTLGFRDRRDPFHCTGHGCRWAAVVVADGADGDGVTIEDQHLAHVAAILRAYLAAVLTTPTTEEAVVRGMQTCGGHIHGPLNMLAGRALAAVRAVLGAEADEAQAGEVEHG